MFPTLRDSDWIGLGWGLGLCIFKGSTHDSSIQRTDSQWVLIEKHKDYPRGNFDLIHDIKMFVPLEPAITPASNCSRESCSSHLFTFRILNSAPKPQLPLILCQANTASPLWVAGWEGDAPCCFFSVIQSTTTNWLNSKTFKQRRKHLLHASLLKWELGCIKKSVKNLQFYSPDLYTEIQARGWGRKGAKGDWSEDRDS